VEPALAAIWISVALGTALGIWQRFAPRATEPIRTFAVVAAVLVVGLSLLPHALACEGIAGLIGAGLGYAAIPALEQLGLWLFRQGDPRAVRLELGYSGLLLHRFGDGVAMSVDGHGYGVLWALGAHEVPIVALVTLAFARRGLGTALSRAALLGLSSSLGYWLVRATPAPTWHELHGWADAIAAGVLIHIVAHEALEERLTLTSSGTGLAAAPRASIARRTLDVTAAVLALVLVAISGLEHDAEAPGLLEQLLHLALRVAPLWCLGLLARAFVRSLVPSPRGALLQRARDAALDAPLLALSAALLGWRFALLQCGAGLALALAGTTARGTPGIEPCPPGLDTTHPSPGAARRFGQELERSAAELGAWMCLGLLAAAYALAFVPPLPPGGLSLVEQLGWAGVIAALAYASPVAAVPLAAVAVSQGLGAGTALVGLVLGPAAQLLRLRSSAGVPYLSRPVAALAIVSAVSVALGWLLNRMPEFSLVSLPPAGVAPGPIQWLVLACLALVVARRIWRTGIRGWLHDSLAASGLRRNAAAPHVHGWPGLHPSED
jgi:uncharacterized membrane protein YraQ (UPF0718 family)